jgi:hypothetical protein
MKKILILFWVILSIFNYSATYAIEANSLGAFSNSTDARSITSTRPGLTEAQAYKLKDHRLEAGGF